MEVRVGLEWGIKKQLTINDAVGPHKYIRLYRWRPIVRKTITQTFLKKFEIGPVRS